VSSSLATDPRAKLYLIDRVSPGTTFRRNIEISNDTDSTYVVNCYSAAATINNGVFTGSVGDTQNDLTSWIRVGESQVHLRAHKSQTVEVTFSIPKAAESGERYGVIWAETRSNDNGSGIATINRVGIRVYLSVGTGSAPISSFKITSMTPSRDSLGNPHLSAEVENTGERALDISGSLVLSSDATGMHAGPYAATLGTTLAIGQREPVEVNLPISLPKGPWVATLSLESGLTKETAVTEIEFPDSGTGPQVATKADSGFAYVWVLALGLLLLVVASFLWFIPPSSRFRIKFSKRR
jgi:hypothetical protein